MMKQLYLGNSGVNPPLHTIYLYLSNNKPQHVQNDVVTLDNKRIERIKKLARIAALPDNWNGNGAKAFSGSLIHKARELLWELVFVPEVFPTAEGALQFEYDKLDKSHLEIEIFEDVAEVYMIDKKGKETETNITPDAESINKVVAAFYE